ncbi:MAG: ribonuclease G [Xanthomonadales bacterium]|nr:ribonuclease G [Xanthomonadales bacterium]
MSEEILINSTPTESRVAVVENGMLQEVYLERSNHNGYVGNIYRGRVSRVLPGMQAAFIDIGLERTAFLHASDIVRMAVENGSDLPDKAPPFEPVQAPPIQDLVREQSEITVQVLKDPIGSKGARVSSNLSIPSRFLVLLPESDTIGISARIEDESERQRLKDMIDRLRPDSASHGYIVRTNAEGVDDFALAADMTYLNRVWEAIRSQQQDSSVGDCIYQDLSLPLRSLRDLVHCEVERVRIDDEAVFDQVVQFVRGFVPEWSSRIERYESRRPIFDLYGIEDEIDHALSNKTQLKSGGYLVIDQTEAMTTIDVNTGAFIGQRTQEDTVYKTNLEAAQAIARQLRLRNLGGIIIVDFIDMADNEHQQQVLKTLTSALARDHARTSVSEFSALGLVEMTRKRTTESLRQLMCEPCPVCAGDGDIKSIETVCQEVFREIMRSVRQFEAKRLLVVASSAVVDHVLDEQSAMVAELEELTGRSIRFQREDQYTQEQFDVVLL